ncbi:MAG: aminoacetone oxidase family FAD-binding enzyme [Gammaproteobacteria bacterium]|nr:MAG: aminoacetone oxidase family FAD-binding enzyme [Gammaproteobacteria bacterium]
MSEKHQVDVVIIGAGAAGLMCAITAGKRGRKVLLLDHANKVGKKILMSGGGRCNFTNLFSEDENFISHNPHFFKSALSRFTQWDFIALVEKYNIPYHEKKLGQLFCDNKASDIVQMLVAETQAVAVEIRKRCSILEIKKTEQGFSLNTSIGDVRTKSLVIATGGLSIPTMGATGFGYEVARQFGLSVLQTRAALVPFTFSQKQHQQFDGLSGLSTEVEVESEGQFFTENILFTHKGLSGPAILQISNYWKPGGTVSINLFPKFDLLQHLKQQQKTRPKAGLVSILSQRLPKKMADQLVHLWCPIKNMADYNYKELEQIAERFTCWKFTPADTEGYRTAEVTLGGVDVDQLSSKTMQTLTTKGLYFIGEVVDVTAHLGGFNFQWAWASGAAAGEHV